MIIRCPSCSTRREVPNLDAAGPATVMDCANCGHHWIEGAAQPSAAEVRPEVGLSPAGPAKEPDMLRLLQAAKGARQEFQKQRRARYMHLGAWGGLAVLAVAPFATAVAFPDRVVAAIPISVVVYDWLGQDVNIYGLDIRQVDLRHLIVDGRKVIAVKGQVANASATMRKIPWLRFALRGKDNAEVYHWILNTEARPLKPGESTSFVTRLASPPEAASKLEIRFARADEIGSNDGP